MTTFAIYHRAKQNRNSLLGPCVLVPIHITEGRFYSWTLTCQEEKGRTCRGRGQGRDTNVLIQLHR